MSAIHGQLCELLSEMKITVELIIESAELLAEEVTEVELCGLERNVRILREEFDKAAELEEEFEFKRYAESRYQDEVSDGTF